MKYFIILIAFLVGSCATRYDLLDAKYQSGLIEKKGIISVTGIGHSKDPSTLQYAVMNDIINHLSLYCGASISVKKTITTKANQVFQISIFSDELMQSSLFKLVRARYYKKHSYYDATSHNYVEIAQLDLPKSDFDTECELLSEKANQLALLNFENIKAEASVKKKTAELNAALLETQLSDTHRDSYRHSTTKSSFYLYEKDVPKEIISDKACQEAIDLASIELSKLVNGQTIESLSISKISNTNSHSSGYIQFKVTAQTIQEKEGGVLCAVTILQM